MKVFRALNVTGKVSKLVFGGMSVATGVLLLAFDISMSRLAATSEDRRPTGAGSPMYVERLG